MSQTSVNPKDDPKTSTTLSQSSCLRSSYLRIFSRDVARVATVTAIAIYLCQSAISLGCRVPSGSRTSSGCIISTTPIGTCPLISGGKGTSLLTKDSARLRLDRPDALEILERCDRLRKEFGVYIEPSKIPSKQTPVDLQYDTETKVSRCQRDGFTQWKESCNREGIDRARQLFWRLGASQIEEAADVRSSTAWKIEIGGSNLCY